MLCDNGDLQLEWDYVIDTAVFFIRNTPHTATKMSPHDLMLSRNVSKDGDEDLNSEDEALALLADEGLGAVVKQAAMKRCRNVAANFQEASTLLAERASQNIEKATQKQKKGFDAKHQNKGVALSNSEPFAIDWSWQLLSLLKKLMLFR